MASKAEKSEGPQMSLYLGEHSAKRCSVSMFKNVCYIHLNCYAKKKSFSFSKEEFDYFVTSLPTIKEWVNTLSASVSGPVKPESNNFEDINIAQQPPNIAPTTSWSNYWQPWSHQQPQTWSYQTPCQNQQAYPHYPHQVPQQMQPPSLNSQQPINNPLVYYPQQ